MTNPVSSQRFIFLANAAIRRIALTSSSSPNTQCLQRASFTSSEGPAYSTLLDSPNLRHSSGAAFRAVNLLAKTHGFRQAPTALREHRLCSQDINKLLSTRRVFSTVHAQSAICIQAQTVLGKSKPSSFRGRERSFASSSPRYDVKESPATDKQDRSSLATLEKEAENDIDKPYETWEEKVAREEAEHIKFAEEEAAAKKEEIDSLQTFKPSEKALRASQVNLSARLSSRDAEKEGKWAGSKGTWRLLMIARPEAKWLGVAFCCLLVSSAITMAIPFSIGRILDMATHSGDSDALLFGLTMPQFYTALAGIFVLGASANYSRIIVLRIVGERLVARMRTQLYRRIYIQDAEFFDANRVGDLLSRLNNDTIIVGKSITQNLSDGLRSIVSGGAGFAAMAWVSLKLSGVLLVMLPPMAVGAFFYGRFARSISQKIQAALGVLSKIAEERLGNIKTSQAFAGEQQEIGRYNRQVRKIFALGKRDAAFSALFFSSTSFLGNVTIMSILYAGSSMVKSGTISVGELTSFLMYAGYAASSMFGVTGFFSELMKGVGAASRLFELQDKNPTISPTVGSTVKSAQGPIRFRDVTFAYPTRPALTIFEGLDFEIPSGSNVAIVGPSGGGKSTISSLLLRFYSPTAGTISINGTDISTMNAKSLRRRIGFVGQEPVLMSGSIAENIAYGKPRATRSEIIAAAKKANCQFIEDFPDGLDTSVGARGAQLSGGQKQRIAIARALLKEPDILILDEATSALDAESETLVNSALAALLRGHNTTISIAHRLSTIKRSDRIIVLGNNGKVAEQGSYKELSANPNSAFSLLMEWQMSGEDAADKRPAEEPRHVTQKDVIEEDLKTTLTPENKTGA